MYPNCLPMITPIGDECLVRPPLAMCHCAHSHDPISQPHMLSDDHPWPISTNLLLDFPSYCWVLPPFAWHVICMASTCPS